MNNQSLRAAALIFFFAAASTVAAFGQDGVRINNEDECQKRQEKLIKELMRATLDYWSPRFTAYQALIDKTLSKEDLQDLNQLRGRFLLALKTEKEKQARLDRRNSAEREANMRSMAHGGSMDGNDRMMPDSAMMANYDSHAAAAYASIDSAAAAANATVDSAARAVEARMGASTEVDTATVSSDNTEHPYMRDDADMPYGDITIHRSGQARMKSKMDLESINEAAMKLAERYESRLQELDGRMKNDIMEFLLVAAGKMRGFGARNDMEMCESANFMIDQVVAMETDSIRRNAANDFLEKIGGTQANAFLMLVGNDITGVLKTMMQGEAGDFSNILPRRESTPALSSAMLEQNAPNPAAISTEIAYTLPEPSSATVITLYSTDGKTTVAYDQGPRPAGRQVAKIDVGPLTPGTYVYRLKISTSAGDQVFSKTMQVVR
ncbi:MAG: T9SS type A sorting domain-containing protein [Candidatus Kapaibacterium sp.]